jgi:hypothetical protein
METNSNIFKTNFKHNDYLYNCDFVNKYAIKTIYQKPKLQKISISFSINQLKKTGIIENDRTISIKQAAIAITIISLIVALPHSAEAWYLYQYKIRDHTPINEK